jgi:serine/threonine-protein kinase
MTDDQVVLGNRYQLGDRLGRGGMAEVRRGFDLRLERTVAVKCLKVELAADPSFQKRFQREAHAAASLNHPGIAAVYDTGEQVDETTGVSVPFLVMELVDGPTLRDVLREKGPMPPGRALELTRVVLGALGHSHAAGIVHRDIKPSNIMLTPKGDAKVMDFGIARAAAETTSDLTGTATVIGTAHYLSPEQARGERVDQRSDLYSTGCLLYELLLGRPPFLGDSSVSVAYQHVREMPVPPSEVDPSLSADVDAVVARALAKDPADRYQSAEEMAADISRVLAGLPAHAAQPSELTEDTHVAPASVPSPVTEVEGEATHGLRGPVVPAAAGAAMAAGVTTAADGTIAGGAPPTASTAVVTGASEPPEARRPSAGRTVLVALLTLLVLGGVAFGAYWLLAGDRSTNVIVPSVLGSTRQTAEQKLREAGLQPAFRNVSGPDNDSVLTVIGQSPERDVEVARNSTVTAEINVGPPTERIPKDLVGRDLDEVVEELTDAGFKNVTAVPVDDPPADADAEEVVKVDPGEGEKAAPEEDITVSYVGRAVPSGTSRTEQQPGGGGTSVRPSDTEESADDEQVEQDEESGQSSEPGDSTSPSDEATSTEPSSSPTASAEPEPSASEPSASKSKKPKDPKPSGEGPSGPSGAPPGEDASASVGPAKVSQSPGGLGLEQSLLPG